eukprot:1452634-Alexandrium_andersonii.AAC.1
MVSRVQRCARGPSNHCNERTPMYGIAHGRIPMCPYHLGTIVLPSASSCLDLCIVYVCAIQVQLPICGLQFRRRCAGVGDGDGDEGGRLAIRWRGG